LSRQERERNREEKRGKENREREPRGNGRERGERQESEMALDCRYQTKKPVNRAKTENQNFLQLVVGF